MSAPQKQSQHAPPAAHDASSAMSAKESMASHGSTLAPGSSWIYLFSQFTTEALLFEGLLISVLCAAYAAFWILRKRRLGVIDQAVPAGVVRTYLNALILDAESLRAQLFGLLASHGIQLQPGTGASAMAAQFMTAAHAAPPTSPHPATGAGLGEPELLKKFSELERKMLEQTQAMDSIAGEKIRLEKELAEAKTKGGNGSGASAGDTAEFTKKISELEARLAEYSVIEDDLANLKRLQQENAQLKAALAGAGGAVAAGSAIPAPTIETEPVATIEAASQAEPEPVLAAEVAPVAEPTENAQFENLVDQVEQSLQDAPAAEAEAAPIDAALATPEPEAAVPSATAASDAPAAETTPMSAEAAPTPESDKSNDDLVAEFEKMLNS